jgi:hypothetical protein
LPHAKLETACLPDVLDGRVVRRCLPGGSPGNAVDTFRSNHLCENGVHASGFFADPGPEAIADFCPGVPACAMRFKIKQLGNFHCDSSLIDQIEVRQDIEIDVLVPLSG